MDPEQSKESGTIIVFSTPERLNEVSLKPGLEKGFRSKDNV